MLHEELEGGPARRLGQPHVKVGCGPMLSLLEVEEVVATPLIAQTVNFCLGLLPLHLGLGLRVRNEQGETVEEACVLLTQASLADD